MTEARHAVRITLPGTLEWGTPVLYLRSADGAIFDDPERQSENAAAGPRPGAKSEPIGTDELDSLYTEGLAEYHIEHWDEAVDAFGPSDAKRDVASLLPLMRAGYRLSQTGDADADLQKLLDEAVTVFGAQRGGILFTDLPNTAPVVRCVSVTAARPVPARTVSKTPADVVGLTDRGEIAAGKRSDLIRVHQAGDAAAVRSVWCGGNRVA